MTEYYTVEYTRYLRSFHGRARHPRVVPLVQALHAGKRCVTLHSCVELLIALVVYHNLLFLSVLYRFYGSFPTTESALDYTVASTLQDTLLNQSCTALRDFVQDTRARHRSICGGEVP